MTAEVTESLERNERGKAEVRPDMRTETYYEPDQSGGLHKRERLVPSGERPGDAC